MSILITAGLVLARVSGLLMSMPLLNARMIPGEVKAILAMLLTAILAPTMPEIHLELSFGLLLVSMAAELMLGILMGGSLTLIFASLSIMAGVVSSQIGQAAAIQFNPTMSVSSTPVGNIAMFMALAVFLGADSHLVLLRLLAQSFYAVPVDQVLDPIAGGQIWLEYSKDVFLIALKMSAPILMLVLLINSFVAILAKVAPTMNMFFSVGFVATMIVGMLLFMYLLPNILVYHQQLIDQALEHLPEIFPLVSGKP